MRSQRVFGVLGVLVMLGLLGFTAYTTVPTLVGAPGVPSGRPYPEPTDPGHKRAFHEICPAINRPEVLALVGDLARLRGQGTSYTADSLSCNVSGSKVAIRLEVGHNLSITPATWATPHGRSLTVLGRPAYLETTTGSLASTTLLVAREASGTGDYASILVLTATPLDEAAMVRLAELILPHVAGWTA